MSLAILKSRALSGMKAPEVTVEVHLANGLPSFTIVGLPETEVKEAKDRVRGSLAKHPVRISGKANNGQPRSGRSSKRIGPV